MPTPHDRLSSSLVAAGLDFHRMQLWKEMQADAMFLVRVPENPDPLVAAVFGQGGEHFGISLYRGRSAIESARRLIVSPNEGRPPIVEGTVLLTISFDRLEAIPMDRRRILTDAGFTGRRESLAPAFIASLPEKYSRLPNRTEMRDLVDALKAIRVARESGPLEGGSIAIDDELLLIRMTADDGKKPRITRERELLPTPDGKELELKIDRNAVLRTERSNDRWIAGFVDTSRLPIGAFGKTDDSAFVVFEESRGDLMLAIYADPAAVSEIGESLLQSFLEQRARGRSGRPSEIVFLHAGLERWLAKELVGVGVKSSHVPQSNRFEEILQGAARELQRALDAAIGDTPPVVDSEPATLAEWKAVDKALTSRMSDFIFSSEDETAAAIEEFFGDLSQGILEMEERPHDSVSAFEEWYATRRLGDRHQRTLVDRWIELAQSPAVSLLLKARRDAAVSIYRVDSLDPAQGKIGLVDIFTGSRRTILDRALANSAELEFIIPFRLFDLPIGTFAAISGPPMRALEFDAAMEFLERMGGQLTPERLRDEPECLGRLFAWQRERAARPARSLANMRNTDGDPLVFQTVTFSLADRDAALSFLRAHAEIEPDAPDAESGEGPVEFTWLKTTKKGKSLLGGPTSFARIAVHSDRIQVEVNSDSRAKKVRKLLEGIRGVRFVRSETIDPLAARSSSGESGTKPLAIGPNTPEAIAAIRAFLHQRNMEWLDMRIPMLGNQTPREFARTPDGRKRVAMMIRTMPAASGPDGTAIEPPRAEMLRELGIEGEDAMSSG